ncbi:hypothetical protein [Streptomyces sp. NPDC018000]|uniref:hypothetical protein n=1 Tax=Streptomyces sp. NPDC018000 TaxID=3365028 RepID=UPI003788B9A6
MTVHITDVGAAILVVASVVGYLVYKHSQATPGPASKGDLVGAITCGVAVLTALVLLLGGGTDPQTPATPGDAVSVPPRT